MAREFINEPASHCIDNVVGNQDQALARRAGDARVQRTTNPGRRWPGRTTGESSRRPALTCRRAGNIESRITLDGRRRLEM
jgi:hypothetical protein